MVSGSSTPNPEVALALGLEFIIRPMGRKPFWLSRQYIAFRLRLEVKS
jgi:hypothetical protein